MSHSPGEQTSPVWKRIQKSSSREMSGEKNGTYVFEHMK